jgi:hypothetical protein
MLNPGVSCPQPPVLPFPLDLLEAQTTGPSSNPSVIPHPATDGINPQPGAPAPTKASLKAALGDRRNWQALGQKLNELATRLGVNASPQAVLAALSSTPMEVDPESSYPTEGGNAVTLETFIRTKGLHVPISHFELSAHADAVNDKALAHPFGNFGGGLSWPMPMSLSDQRTLLSAAILHASANPNSPEVGASLGVLEYLNGNRPFPADELHDPANVLTTLVGSARGQALGQAMQSHLNGVSTGASVNEYALTAINLVLDPESVAQPHRTRVAGFDLAQPLHCAKPASAVLDGLIAHLTACGKTTPEMATVGAHLLLARKAPEFLVKDIPGNVTYGSPAWVSLAVAVANIEARLPGATSQMTYVDVMIRADKAASSADPASLQEAQRNALVDWGIANGWLEKSEDDHYTAEQLETLKTTFNRQQGQLMSAAQLMNAPLPSRREMALARLKETFGDNVELFERRSIRNGDSQVAGKTHYAFNGVYSMLDIAMQGVKNVGQWVSDDPQIPIDAVNADTFPSAVTEFQARFDDTIKGYEQVHATTARHLISQMPQEDRDNFVYGNKTYYQDAVYVKGSGFLDGRKLESKRDKLTIKIERNGRTFIYEVDTQKAVVNRLNLDPDSLEESRNEGRWVYETKVFKPFVAPPANSGANPQVGLSPSKAFDSDEIKHVASTLVEALDLRSDDILLPARGSTAFDKEQAQLAAFTEFKLNLIPFRSAIVNFRDGNYGEGSKDLVLDAFGFLTAGAGNIGKVGKVANSAISTLSKVVKTAKVLGAVIIGELNPLGGVLELTVGIGRGGKLLVSKGVDGINKLRGVTAGHDLLKAVSKDYEVAATGTFKIAEQSVEGTAVLQNGKWYAFDADKMQPYGAPIENFTPARIEHHTAVPGMHEAVPDTDASPINGPLESWYQNWFGGTSRAPDPFLNDKFKMRVDNLQFTPNKQRYDIGHTTGQPSSIPGYSSDMTNTQLKELALNPDMSAEHVGSLVRLLETRKARKSIDDFIQFRTEVEAAGGAATAMPQNFYLSQFDVLSNGECAAISNTMALAIQHGKEEVLIGNLLTVAGKPNERVAETFRRKLTNLHGDLAYNYHGTREPIQKSYKTIIDDLATATTSKTFKISDQGHGFIAGVIVDANKGKQWFYFDPTFGLAKFPTQQSMQRGLESTLNSGRTGGTLRPVNADRANPEYRVTEFSDTDLFVTSGQINPMDFFAHPLYQTSHRNLA